MNLIHWFLLAIFVGWVAFTPAGVAIGNFLIGTAKTVITATATVSLLRGTSTGVGVGGFIALPLYLVGWMLRWAAPLLLIGIIYLPFYVAGRLIWPRLGPAEIPEFVRVDIRTQPHFHHRRHDGEFDRTKFQFAVSVVGRPDAPANHAYLDGLICDVEAMMGRKVERARVRADIMRELSEGQTAPTDRREWTWVSLAQPTPLIIEIASRYPVERPLVHSCRAYGHVHHMTLTRQSYDPPRGWVSGLGDEN